MTNSPDPHVNTVLCPQCQGRYEHGTAFCPKDGSPLGQAVSNAPDRVGTILADRYRITKKLGEGGMGEVYAADHIYIDKKFALKLLKPEITSDPEAVARFHQEARSASTIGHENIIEIDDFGRLADGSVYLAMEFLSGTALSDRMKQEPALRTDEALSIMVQVGRGLAAAHAKGIVHRDMKPENIFLAQRGGGSIVKILDFGIAKVSGADGQQRLTRTGAIFGTPHYMSPEQALGKGLDHRADIYSVGVIMYEVFSGQLPFVAETFMGILTQHLTQQPRPPTQAAPERNIPPAIEAIILKAMAKEPSQRQQSMGEIVAELEAAAQTLGLALPTTSQVMAIAAPSGVYHATGSGAVGGFDHTARPGQTGQTGQSFGLAATGRPGTGPFAVPTGSQPHLTPLPSGGMASAASVSQASLPGVEAPRKSNVGLIVGLVALVLVGGTGVAAVILRAIRPPPGTATTEPRGQTPVAPVTNVAPPPPVTPTAGAKQVEILVDSVPPGATILSSTAAVIGTCPEVVRVDEGKTLDVTLKLQNFKDKTITLDPAREHKRLIRLERIEREPTHSAPPPTTHEATHQAPHTTPPPVRLTPTPVERPRPTDPDILNPY